MFENIFLFLEKEFKHKEILIYGELLPQEYEILSKLASRIVIVNENISEILKLKEKYKEIELETSLYFVKEKFDFLLNFSSLPIPISNLKELGIYIEFHDINNDENYYNLILDSHRKEFKYNKNIEFNDKKVLVITDNNSKHFLDYNDNEVAQVLLKLYSNRVL
jgi:hypothetical protein